MANDQNERERLFQWAILADETHRYDDMKQSVKQLVVEAGESELTDEERSALSTAYKNSLGALRMSWEVLDFAARQIRSKIPTDKSSPSKDIANEKKLEIAESYLGVVSKELSSLCDEVIDLLDRYLIPNAKQDQTKVIYLKMKGDYLRYQVQISVGEQRALLSDRSSNAYEAANELACKQLDPIDPIRLGLSLNYSVFHYEVRKDPVQACLYAKKAFGDAIENLDKIAKNNKKYKESTHIMQLLRDNQAMWSSEIKDNTEINKSNDNTGSP